MPGPTTPSVDLLVCGGDVLTMDHDRRIVRGAAVAVAGGEIVEIGAVGRLRAAHPGAAELDATGAVVLPGLVNAHQHLTGDPLIASCIPDRIDSDTAIHRWAVPVHAVHEPDDDLLAAQLEALRCLHAGTTTVVEAGTVAHPDQVAKALHATGIRGTVGAWGWDAPDVPFAASSGEVLARQEDLIHRHPTGGRVQAWVTLVGHTFASDELFVGASELARRTGTGLTFHLSPTPADAEGYLSRTGRRPVEHLARLGVLGPHVLVAHAVWLDDREVELLLEHDVAVAYCPWAYLRLGQGATVAGRHAELVERGGRMALGGDAANAADHHSMLATAALAAGLARDTRTDPLRFGAHQALELATVRGAAAIGRPDLGTIATGRPADLVVVEAGGIEWSPAGDPVLQLVWGAPDRRIRHAVVDGVVVLADGRSTLVDEDALVAEVADRQRSLLRRAGIDVPRPWPVSTAT